MHQSGCGCGCFTVVMAALANYTWRSLDKPEWFIYTFMIITISVGAIHLISQESVRQLARRRVSESDGFTDMSDEEKNKIYAQEVAWISGREWQNGDSVTAFYAMLMNMVGFSWFALLIAGFFL